MKERVNTYYVLLIIIKKGNNTIKKRVFNWKRKTLKRKTFRQHNNRGLSLEMEDRNEKLLSVYEIVADMLFNKQ